MGAATVERKYSEAVESRLRPSAACAACLHCAGGATLAVLLATPMPWWAHAAAALAVAAGTIDALRRVAHREGRGAVAWLRLHRAGRIEVRDAAGRAREGTLRDGSFVAPWLTIVRWRPAGARFDRTFVLLPDMLPRDAFRRVRVLLRWG